MPGKMPFVPGLDRIFRRVPFMIVVRCDGRRDQASSAPSRRETIAWCSVLSSRSTNSYGNFFQVKQR